MMKPTEKIGPKCKEHADRVLLKRQFEAEQIGRAWIEAKLIDQIWHSGHKQGVEESIAVVRAEPELPGDMPPKLFMEDPEVIVRATVVVTKKSIEAAIRKSTGVQPSLVTTCAEPRCPVCDTVLTGIELEDEKPDPYLLCCKGELCEVHFSIEGRDREDCIRKLHHERLT